MFIYFLYNKMPKFKAYSPNENGWYENGIYKAVVKEMAMANSSYARAAGIQSEISKVTVTRVASREVECKRQTNVYKKDMIITVNNISREQRLLRKAMVRYSKKKKQHKLVKEKREQQILERERREREHLEQWEQIQAFLSINNGDTAETASTDKTNDEHNGKNGVNDELDGATINDENNNETVELKDNKTKKKRNGLELSGKEQTLNLFDVLPSISEAENEQEVNMEEEQEIGQSDDKPSTSDTKQSSEESSSTLSPLFALTLRPLKPKKQVVSFSDIIKLKHSHNTNKLFDMVHVLAEKHGVNESVEKRRAERRNSRIPKGSTDAVISESLRKAASVIYPMKFGYGDHESNNKEKFDFLSGEQLNSERSEMSVDKDGSDQSSEKSLNNKTSFMKTKRYKSTPTFNEEMKKFRKEEMLKNGLAEEGRRFTHLSNKSSSLKFLPAINSTKSSPRHSRSNSVSWTEAFGLLKIVHSIE